MLGFDRSAVRKWDAIEAVTGTELKPGLTKMSVMARSHHGFKISGNSKLQNTLAAQGLLNTTDGALCY